MYTFLIIVLVLISAVLVGAILLQAGKGGGLAASFGGVSSSSDSFLGTRQAGNLLTKMSWWCGGLFLGISFVLSLMTAGSRTPRSVLDQPAGPAPQQTTPSTTAPAVPLEPATPATGDTSR